MRTTNAARLRALMTRHRLTYRAVADLAGVSAKTIESWLATPGLASHRLMPDRALKLIELQLKTKRPSARKT